MGRKRIPGTFTVEQRASGTPVVRGTATVNGRRKRKSQTFPSVAAAHAMSAALTKAADFYRSFSLNTTRNSRLDLNVRQVPTRTRKRVSQRS